VQRVPQREEDAYFVDKRMTSGGIADAEMDDATQERARKEWLQYHLQTANWAAAEELVVTSNPNPSPNPNPNPTLPQP
jgi:hypothetical protein